jgi:hypothetical protein
VCVGVNSYRTDQGRGWLPFEPCRSTQMHRSTSGLDNELLYEVLEPYGLSQVQVFLALEMFLVRETVTSYQIRSSRT